MHRCIVFQEQEEKTRAPNPTLMKSDIEKKIEARVAAAFDDILSEGDGKARNEILKGAQELVQAVWVGKIYAALPKDKTMIPEYFFDAELDEFLNEAVEECHKLIGLIAERAREEVH